MVEGVDFVEGDDQFDFEPCKAVEQFGVLVLDVAGFDEKEEDVGVFEGVFQEAHHSLLQGVGGADDSGGVAEDDLCVFSVYDPENSVPCGLCFARNDAEFLAEHGVHQGAFAHIGPAEYVYESAFHGAKVDISRPIDFSLSIL